MIDDERPQRRGYGRQPSLNEYALVAWRRKWLILAVAVAAAALGFFYSYRQVPVYEASAYVMYLPDSTAALVGSGQFNSADTRAVELQNVGTIIASPIIGDRVASAMGWGGRPPWFTVQSKLASSLGDGGDTTNSNVTAVTAQARDPSVAAALANTYAQQFVDWRLTTQRDQIAKAQQIVSDQLQRYVTPASRLSSDYGVLKDRLQTLNVMYGTATGAFQVIMPATVPKAAISPRPKRSALAGLALGMIAGLGLAFILEQVDRRLRDYKEAGEILGLRIIGRIPRMLAGSLKAGPLYVLNHPMRDGADALRMLRTNLEFLSLEPDVKVVGFVSPGKGDGKTVTLCNLAVALALSGKRVIVVDADLREPGVATAFGLRNTTGVTDVIRGRRTLADAFQEFLLPRRLTEIDGSGDLQSEALDGAAHDPGLLVLASGALPPNPGEVVGSRRFGELLREIGELGVDYVLVDSPGLLGDAAAIAAHVDGLIFVVNVDEAKRSKLEEAREAIEPLPCAKLGMVAVSKAFRSSSTAEYAR